MGLDSLQIKAVIERKVCLLCLLVSFGLAEMGLIQSG